MRRCSSLRRHRSSVHPIAAACQAQAMETLESRLHLAAHIVGSTTTYSTIQAAVNAAAAGAVITVDAGTYSEKVTVNKLLTIRGAKAGVDARTRATTNESILNGVLANSARTCSFYITANDVTIDGFNVQGETDKSVSMGAGIVIAPNVAGTHILNNIVQNNVAGLFLASASSTDAALIQYNLFQNNNNAGTDGGRGIYTDAPIFGKLLTNVTIDSNTFTGNRGGSGTTGLESAMAFESATAGLQTNIRITNNTITNNGKSVLFFNTTGVLIQGNTVTGALDWYSGSLRFEGNNQNVTIQYNNIVANTGPGVGVDSSGAPGDSSGFVVTNNNIYGNGTTSGGKLGVVYNQNSYVGTFDARNNWWGNASGPGGDGPGTGDTVYGNAYKTGNWHVAKGGSELYAPWSTAPITFGNVAPSAPTGLAARAVSTSQITLTWTDTAVNQTGVKVDRSTDNVNFTLLTTLGATATTYADNAVSVGVTYYYRVRATNSFGDSANTGVVSATPLSPSQVTVNLSDLAWASATAGWGSVQKDRSINANPLTLNGVQYAKGLGTHAVSNIVYNLNGQYANFNCDVGVDDEVNGKGTGVVDFKVMGDGKVLYDSGVLTNGAAPGHISISVAGVQQMTLVATNGVAGSIDFDHADWAGAQLVATAAAPTAPTNLAATALSTSSIKLGWTNTSANQTSITIDRSTDGSNFTTVATGVSPSATSWTDNGPLAANTVYYYRIRAINSTGASPNSNVANAATLPATTVTYLSDLPWTSATAGWGTVQTDQSIKGNPITLKGVVYSKGIGTHAASSITYNLAGKYTNFLADVGIDDEVSGTGAVIFQVIGDGKVLFDSGVLTNASPTVSINVPVAGVQTLTLVATNGVTGSIDYDHADWAGARLIG